MADMMAGSDLDGDTYSLIRLPALCDRFEPSEPWDARPSDAPKPTEMCTGEALEAARVDSHRSCEVSDRNMRVTADLWQMVGAVTDADRGWGVNSETAIELAYLYMKALDAGKKGIRVEIPQRLMSLYGGVLPACLQLKDKLKGKQFAPPTEGARDRMFVEWESGRLVKEVEDTAFWEDPDLEISPRPLNFSDYVMKWESALDEYKKAVQEISKRFAFGTKEWKSEFNPLVHKYRTLLLEAHSEETRHKLSIEENTVLHEAYALKCVVYRRLKQPPRPAPPDAKCYGCGQLGHYASECPNVEGSKSQRRFFCWLVGGDYLAPGAAAASGSQPAARRAHPRCTTPPGSSSSSASSLGTCRPRTTTPSTSDHIFYCVHR